MLIQLYTIPIPTDTHPVGPTTIATAMHTDVMFKGLADSGASRSIISTTKGVTHLLPYHATLTDAGGQSHTATHSGVVLYELISDAGNPFTMRIPVLIVPTMQGFLINTTDLHQTQAFTGTIGPTGTTWISPDGHEYTCPIENHQEIFRGRLLEQPPKVATVLEDPSKHYTTQHTPTAKSDNTGIDAEVSLLLRHLKEMDCTPHKQDELRTRLAHLGCITTSSDKDAFLQLHCKLGHRSIRDTLAVARQLRLPIGKYAQIVCDTCERYKSKRKPFKKLQTNPHKYNAFECWNVDSWDAPRESRSLFGGHRKMLTFIDHATRTAIPIFLPSVTSLTIADALDQFSVQVTRLVDHAKHNAIKLVLGPNIVMDSAAYFKTTVATNAFRKHGFRRIFYSPPHSQSMNGRIERWFQTVSASANAMLHASGLSLSLWPQAYRHASHIYDLVPHSALGISPYEARNCTPPDLSHLHIWGSRCWCSVDKTRRRKGQEKGTPGHYMGYDTASRSHWVWTRDRSGKDWLAIAYHVEIDDTIPPSVLNNTTPTVPDDIDDPDLEILPSHDVLAIHSAPTDLRYREVKYYHYRGAIRDPEWGKYFEGTLDTEVGELIRMGALIPIQHRDLLPSEKVNSTTCLYTIKLNSDGTYKGKCRLVFSSKGQRPGIDYDFKTSHHPSWAIIRMHLALKPVRSEDDHLCLIDIKKAFVRTKNHTPSGQRVIIKLQSDAVYKDDSGVRWEYMIVDSALYGQVNSGYLWQQCLWSFLRTQQWNQCSDRCTWVRRGARIVVYTDDIIFRGAAAERDRCIHELNTRFPGCTITDGSRILGHQVTKNADGTYSISSARYIEESAARFGVSTRNLTPLPAGVIIHRIANPDAFHPGRAKTFQEITGVISWLATTSRPDIAYAASALGQVSHNPSALHLKYAKRTLGYLLRTCNYTIRYLPGNNTLSAYADASYADSIANKSQTGYVILLNGAPVAWRSRCQSYVSHKSRRSSLHATQCEKYSTYGNA